MLIVGWWEGWRLGFVEIDGNSDGIELGADEIEGCNVGCPEGDIEIEGAMLSCKVGIGDKLGISLGNAVGIALLVGLKLGSSDGAALMDGPREGWKLGLVEIDGKSVGNELGSVEIEGCKVGWVEGAVDIEGARLLCNVGPVDVVRWVEGMLLGILLKVGLELGYLDGDVLIGGWWEGWVLGWVETDDKPDGVELGCDEIEGCKVGLTWRSCRDQRSKAVVQGWHWWQAWLFIWKGCRHNTFGGTETGLERRSRANRWVLWWM
jgi:hypothetical protein